MTFLKQVLSKAQEKLESLAVVHNNELMSGPYPAQLLIVLLLCAQFTLTVHALEHSFEPDNDKVCQLCWAAGSQGHALASMPAPPQAVKPAPDVKPIPSVFIQSVSVYHQLIRAPPDPSPCC